MNEGNDKFWFNKVYWQLCLVLDRINEQIMDDEQKIQDLSLDGVYIPEITAEVKEKIGLQCKISQLNCFCRKTRTLCIEL